MTDATAPDTSILCTVVEEGPGVSAGHSVSQETVSAVLNGKPYAPVIISNEKPINVLFDTGSESSLLSIDSLKSLDVAFTIEQCNDMLHGVEGTELKILGSTVLYTTFNGLTKRVRYTLLSNKDVAIFGLRAMNQFQVLIDTERSVLCCNGQEQPFQRRLGKISNVQDSTNLFLSDCEIIPASGHKIVFGYVRGPLPDSKECILDLSYAANRYGLTLPPVVCETDDTIPVYIYNCLPHPLKIKKNAKLGSVSATVVDQTDMMIMENEGAGGNDPVDNHPLPLVDLSHLDAARAKQMGDILVAHQGLFSRSELDVGHCTVRAPKIHLKPGVTPICEPLRKYNQKQVAALTSQVAELEKQNVISRSTSSWRFFPCLANKRCETTGSILSYKRFCLDLRNLNRSTLDSDSYTRAIPRVSDIFDALAYALKGAGDEVYYSKLDISQAFFSIELQDEDKELFSFYTPSGGYMFNRVCYGYKGAPSLFQNIVEQHTLRGLLFEKCFCFIDDILVIGKSWGEMMENLSLVLFRLQAYGFKLKPSKLCLGLQKVPMLGFVLNKNRIELCKNKMRITESWIKPVDKATTISFVQFCSYLRRSIPDFARIAKPLYEIGGQDRPFEWSAEADAAFVKLKLAITSGPVLRLPDYQKSFWLFTDWSKIAVGYVLCQRENDSTGRFHPVVWGSQMLNKSW